MSPRAYADADPSVKHSQRPEEKEEQFVKEAESESFVEASGREEGEEDGGDGKKKKKQRTGFRDRKVINRRKTIKLLAAIQSVHTRTHIYIHTHTLVVELMERLLSSLNQYLSSDYSVSVYILSDR